MIPIFASQMRVAFSSMLWNTGSSSPGVLLMTWRTSDVAVCCSSDFSQIMRARFHLVEQPRVFDRDHGLVGKGRDQFDLPFGKGLHHCAHQGDDADRHTGLSQGHTKHRAVVSGALVFQRHIFGIGQAIRQMNGLLLKSGAADQRTASRRQRMLRGIFDKGSRPYCWSRPCDIGRPAICRSVRIPHRINGRPSARWCRG